MAFGIKIGSEFLDMYPSSTLGFVRNNDLWVTGDPTLSDGSYSFPIDVPLTGLNKRLLQYPHRIDAYQPLKVLTDVTIYIGKGMSVGVPIFSGDLYVKKSEDDKVSVFVVVKGLNRIKELKFQEVDMGVYNITGSLKPVMDDAVDNPLSYPFIFFPVQNSTLTEDSENQKALRNDIINEYDTGVNNWTWHFATNPDLIGNMMIVPFLRLEFVLEKIVEAMGYTIVNEWLTNDELRSICIFNNHSINDLETRHKNIIRYNEHLPPEMTLLEALKSICAWHFIGLFADHVRKVITLIPYRDVINEAHSDDWSIYALKGYVIEQDNQVPLTIGYDTDPTDSYFSRNYVSDEVLLADGAFVDDYYKAGGDYDTHGLVDGFYNVKRNGGRYRYDLSKTNPFEKWYITAHRFNAVDIGGRGQDIKSKVIPLYDADLYAAATNVTSVTLPIAEITMNIKYKDDEQVKTITQKLESLRPTIYRGFREFPLSSNPFPYANNSAYDPANEDETFDHSLHYDGERGIYALYGREWMEFMKLKKIVKMRFVLPMQMILNYREWQKIRVDNMNYFVKSMKSTATATGSAPVEGELVSIPFS
jgi:hypothetical protein